MLERIGGECAGAVSLFPEDTVPEDSRKAKYRELTEQELQQVVNELPNHPLLVGTDVRLSNKLELRLSLAGAQDKLPVIIDNEKVLLPLGNTPSTHILKPEPDRFPGLAANEVFCMTLAQAIGLNAPDTNYRLIGNKPCLLVKRYDRSIDETGTTVRLHQEDFCQALGFPPERKYQAEGGPTLRNCIALLREWSTAPVLDIPSFINGLIFNVLIGNADAHSKNFSFVYSNGERRLSPYYDLVSTVAWPELSRNLSMTIGGSKSVNAYNIGDWKKMSEKMSLGWPIMRERMTESCHTVSEKLDEVHARVSKHNESMGSLLHKMIAERATQMLDALSNI